MKSLFAVISTATMIFAVPAYAKQPIQPTLSITNEVAHGGGCRKDSPQGQCCHAGKKPYHCH